jgi:hypothetical protein
VLAVPSTLELHRHDCPTLAHALPSTFARMQTAAHRHIPIIPPVQRVQDRRLTRAFRAHVCFLAIFGSAGFALAGCGTSSSGTTPSVVVVNIQPGSATLFLGQAQQFQASVTGNANTSITWEVNTILNGNASVGTISGSGLYTAPAILPNPTTVTVTAVSQADPQAQASVTVNLKDDITVGVAPGTATVPTGGAQVFMANVSATGNPAPGVAWSVNGIAGGNSTLGTIVANGPTAATYTAPVVIPSPATVEVKATSLADNSKFGTASVTISCSASNSISPNPASVSLGQTQTFTASFCLAPGATIAWDVNGVAGGNTTLGSIVNTSANAALYTAPADLPAANPLTIHAIAGVAAASAAVTITSSVSVGISPPTATLATSQRKTFAATVANTPDTAVNWSVNGIPDGNASVGQICVLASNPCAAPPGAISGSVDYLAPAATPTTNPVTLAAVSRADGTKNGTALVLITAVSGPVGVMVSPPYAFAPPSGATLSTVQFFVSVTGTTNTSVIWSVQSAVAGQGCAGAACGSVDANGLYTAPAAAPSPNAISVVATSQADPTKSASATIALTNGPVIERILPSSVLAGAVQSFPFTVQGANFIAGSGSSASAILFNGAARSTTCPTATTCTTALNPADIQSAGTFTVQVQDPGPPVALSNPVPFVILPFNVSEDVISLSPAQPAANGKDIIVVEPTTAAASAAINVDFIGFLTGGNNCGVQGSPLTVNRPASGSTAVSICVHGNGLDPTFTYAFSGPPGGDIGVTASAVTGLFPNTIQLDLRISSTTLPGVRTLSITTLNNDRATATGMLEVR